MLKAIASNKLRPWKLSSGETINGHAAYRDLEDHVTAAVFARLSYLPDDMVWSILHHAVAIPYKKRSYFESRPQIRNYLFWPRYVSEKANSIDGGGYKEPDVVIETSIFTVIVEAKRLDETTEHCPQQIDDEVNSYRFDQDQHESPVCVLLMGGRISPDFREEVTAKNIEVRYISWYDMRRRVIAQCKTIPKGCGLDHYRRVLLDIDEALQLHGVMPTVTIREFPDELVSMLATTTFDTNELVFDRSKG